MSLLRSNILILNNMTRRSFCLHRVCLKDASQEGEACSRAEAQAEKLKKKTPIGKLDDQPNVHPAQEKEPLPAWPNNTNPNTGEVGGPKGPEPTRYGDWERKGRVTDF
eukprot:TRINITY_DN8818_c0_g1_i5.p1 TRINITY_DN8818_c0_g1~~TRINITY_DN8818_c0_g1_i5.p1  ORF type:complete len:108 (-),score=21.47 TRINITY_DN8818_c0_g1_i5:257-580(-)